ncbi:MAG: hypothetical protein A3K19_20610 [Lentisphaerae bacterium RIFOXYB12_FULL_65_16]|nr:MAG: hypothetical protein A3K18_22200 [Lentisphaerae bacterium RIFOXYA12_64_32]OGV89400.1 MAG: hypothetical protein A3K19_20610 [Lentisphaerae bacterium RIFOXYB12_FULL_65_16]
MAPVFRSYDNWIELFLFRTLIDCEYGLNYGAAWEIAAGPGRMLFSQIDVSGRSDADPAARR